jgi:hypothetical protein
MGKTHSSLRSVGGASLALIAAAVFGAVSASAQTAEDGFSVGLAGGFARGSASPFSSSAIGYYVLSTLEFPSPVQVVRPRADVFFADWGGGRVTALTANLLLTPISGRRVAPYALAGAGAYAMPGSGVKAGWTVGAGLRLPGELRTLTVESRVHAFLRANRNVPPYDVGSRWGYVWAPIGLGIQF